MIEFDPNSLNIIIAHRVQDEDSGHVIDCPDGVLAAWVAAKWFSENNLKHGVRWVCHKPENQYTDNDIEWYITVAMKAMERGQQINLIMVDFAAFPELLMKKLAVVCDNVVVLDHHADRFQTLNKVSSQLGNFVGEWNAISNCGATLTWKYFYPNTPMPDWFNAVKNRDSGDQGYYMGKCPDDEALTLGMSRLRSKYGNGQQSFPFFDKMFNEPDFVEECRKIGIPIIEERNKAITNFAKRWKAEPTYIDIEVGDQLFQFPFFEFTGSFLASHYSMANTMLCLQLGFDCGVSRAKKGASVSFRSPETSPPCWKYAHALGGGGHLHAAGADLTNATNYKIWTLNMDNEFLD